MTSLQRETKLAEAAHKARIKGLTSDAQRIVLNSTVYSIVPREARSLPYDLYDGRQQRFQTTRRKGAPHLIEVRDRRWQVIALFSEATMEQVFESGPATATPHVATAAPSPAISEVDRITDLVFDSLADCDVRREEVALATRELLAEAIHEVRSAVRSGQFNERIRHRARNLAQHRLLLDYAREIAPDPGAAVCVAG